MKNEANYKISQYLCKALKGRMECAIIDDYFYLGCILKVRNRAISGSNLMTSGKLQESVYDDFDNKDQFQKPKPKSSFMRL